MTFQPRILHTGILEETKALNCTGVVDSYRVILRRRIPCLEFVVYFTVRSMTAHRRHMHCTEPAIDWSWLPVIQTDHQPNVYNVSFPWLTKKSPFPFLDCPES